MSWILTREHEICCGHTVYGHEGHCKHFHGHNYLFDFHVVSKDTKLDKLGRVIDFAVIKLLLCSWLEENWDHKFLIWNKDPRHAKLKELDPKGVVVIDVNPTVENLAEYFTENIAPGLLISTEVQLVEVKIWETSKCAAIYTVREGYDARAIGH